MGTKFKEEVENPTRTQRMGEMSRKGLSVEGVAPHIV